MIFFVELMSNVDGFSRELLLQGWMKPGRDDLAPNVALVSKRFNEVKDILLKVIRIQLFSRCVDLLSRKFSHNQRLMVEFNVLRNGVSFMKTNFNHTKPRFVLGTVADICRYLRNFNGVLQIMAAFVNSSVFRLKQTWDRISKQHKQVINKLQNLVHSDAKFKNLRDTLTK